MSESSLLYIDKIKNKHEVNGFMSIHLHNEFYKIHIRYMQPDYQTHKDNNDFCASDIHIVIIPTKLYVPDIIFTLKQANNINQTLGISLSASNDIVLYEDMDNYIESLTAAKSTISQLKQIIEYHFSKDMIL